MYFIAALGNPGLKYEKTRHNAGFIAMEELAKRFDLKFKNEPKFQALVSPALHPLQGGDGESKPRLCQRQTGNHPPKGGENKVIFAMPLTYMNNSGIAVSRLAKFYKITPKNIVVIHDEIDLSLEKLRISFGASSGGHNGVESIIRELGTKDFIRLRIGIGNELSALRKISSEKFVLQNFSSDEKKKFLSELGRCADAAETILNEGYKKAMAKFN